MRKQNGFTLIELLVV
ncbi:MAG: prepilin-type N-terminal cleavage/methylation domain-containing protein, partial [Asgard group archaeon]|nr:prepilin-type N-terminal cleavage/methylation domain-containing protein [Asgard group archaeon]